jgi:hypothetical protein
VVRQGGKLDFFQTVRRFRGFPVPTQPKSDMSQFWPSSGPNWIMVEFAGWFSPPDLAQSDAVLLPWAIARRCSSEAAHAGQVVLLEFLQRQTRPTTDRLPGDLPRRRREGRDDLSGPLRAADLDLVNSVDHTGVGNAESRIALGVSDRSTQDQGIKPLYGLRRESSSVSLDFTVGRALMKACPLATGAATSGDWPPQAVARKSWLNA